MQKWKKRSNSTICQILKNWEWKMEHGCEKEVDFSTATVYQINNTCRNL
jgi:hypothetical protein